MTGVFTVTQKTDTTYDYSVGVVGLCGGATTTNGTIVTTNATSALGVFSYTATGNTAAILSDAAMLLFSYDGTKGGCVPASLTCNSGPCKQFPTGVVIAVVVIVLVVIVVGVSVFLWYRKRSSYQSL